MHRFRRQFFLSLGLVFPALIAALVIWTKCTSAEVSAKPNYPVPGRNFVAEYSGVGADAAHMIYYWGLFGMADRIRHAQLLLLGSSHTQFGLSARQLSQAASEQAGQPVRVFNLGLGCGESALFGAKILARHGVQGKAAVADLYNTDSASPCGDAAAHADPISAYFKVLAIWSRFTWDWLLDGNLPEIVLRDGAATTSRFLAGAVVILDWRYGDVTFCSRPSEGEVFPSDEQGMGYPVDGYRRDPAFLPANAPLGKLHAVFAAQRIKSLLTLIPFSGSSDYLPALAEPHDPASGAPFIGISGQQLRTFDHNHLTGESRRLATERLLKKLQEQGFLPATTIKSAEVAGSTTGKSHL